MKKFIIGVLLIVSTLLTLQLSVYSLDNVEKQEVIENEIVEELIIEEQKDKYTKLMIVAHPDDDSIFGGNHLISDDYYVVCVTCGVRTDRLQEFENAMEFTNDEYTYLAHTDLEPNYYISDWDNEKETIENELKEIINSKNWDLIVTHNPDGEYGHKQHKMLNKIVTDNVSDKSKLMYFGKWHMKDEVTEEDLTNLNQTKMELLSKYTTQNLNMNSRFLYMFIHEEWTSYYDWNIDK